MLFYETCVHWTHSKNACTLEHQYNVLVNFLKYIVPHI